MWLSGRVRRGNSVGSRPYRVSEWHRKMRGSNPTSSVSKHNRPYNLVYPTVHVSLRRDNVNCWSIVSSVYAWGRTYPALCQRIHACVNCADSNDRKPWLETQMWFSHHQDEWTRRRRIKDAVRFSNKLSTVWNGMRCWVCSKCSSNATCFILGCKRT